MARHVLELADAAPVPTEAYLLTRRTVSDLFAAGAMGAVHGEAGTGKTFAVEEALTISPSMEVCWLSFPSRPTIRLPVGVLERDRALDRVPHIEVVLDCLTPLLASCVGWRVHDDDARMACTQLFGRALAAMG